MIRKKYRIDFFNDIEEYVLPVSIKAYMQRALGEAVNMFALSEPVSVAVNFVNEKIIKEYNRDNRGIDRVTDVLSFPLQNFSEGNIRDDDLTVAEYDEDDFLMLGDVVICLSVAKKQAQEYGHSEDREIIYLFVHSILHLLGFDHEEDADKLLMREKEEFIMKRIGLGRDE